MIALAFLVLVLLVAVAVTLGPSRSMDRLLSYLGFDREDDQ